MKLPKKIPKGLAFDLLFGSNKIDAHKALDLIYEGFEEEYASRICKNCEHWSKAKLCRNINSFAWEYSATVEASDSCNYFKRKEETND